MINPANPTTLEEHIRERAYRLWEGEGRPEGRALEHWNQARRELEQEVGGGAVVRIPSELGAEAPPDTEKTPSDPDVDEEVRTDRRIARQTS